MNETLYERALTHGLSEGYRQRRPARSMPYIRAWMAAALPLTNGYRLLVWNRPSSDYRRLSPLDDR